MSGGAPDQREKRDRQDVQFLIQRPEFRRFLWRVIQTSRIFSRTADGADKRILDEGRRSLGLEILEMVEAGQPVPHLHPDGPILTVQQAIFEEINQPIGEKKNVKERYDRYTADDDGDGDDPSDAD